MVFGISLSAYTAIHVIISLVAIATGFIAVFQMIANKPLGLWNTIFLWTTIATSVTGFGFPIAGITPAIVVGIISLVILAVRCSHFTPSISRVRGAGSMSSPRSWRSGSTCSC